MSATRTFHVDDVVASKNGEGLENAVGYVDRTYGDIDTHEPYPAETYHMKIHRPKALSRAAYRQFLKDGVPPKGFVLVQWQTHATTDLVSEKDLELLDRNFMDGDMVKRDDEDNNSMTGSIVSVRKQCTLLGMCEAKEPITGKSFRAAWLPSLPADEPHTLELLQEGQLLHNIPANELRLVHQYNERDLIIYKNWLGSIRDCFDEVTVRLLDNGVVTLKDELDLQPLHGDMTDRLSIGSLVKTKKRCLRTGIWRYGAYNPNVPPVGVVVEVRTQEVQVDWLQTKPAVVDTAASWLPPPNMPDAMLSQDDLDSGDVHIYDLTRRPQNNDSVSTKVMSDLEVTGGLRVRFKDAAGASVKYDGSTSHGKFDRVDRRDTLGYDMNVFTITNTLTEVDVQWSDLSMTTQLATSLIPAPDDEDAVFAGEIVCSNEYTTDGPDGTIQPKKVGVVQEVNNVDRVARVRWCRDGQLCFLETTMTTPVPSSWKGIPEGASEEVSFYDIKAPQSINRWRGDFVLLPDVMYEVLGIDFAPGSIHWLGQVVDVKPDGFSIIRLGAAEPVREIGLPTETTVLAFRGGEAVGMVDDGHSDMDDGDAMSLGSDTDDLDDLEVDEDIDMEEGQWFVAGQPGLPVDEEDDSWSTASEDEDGDGDETESANMHVEDPPTSEIPQEITAPPPAAEVAASPQPAKSTIEKPSTTIEEMNLSSFTDAPPIYDVVDTEVPSNHHYGHTVTATSSGHMKAVQKEHRILRGASSLPPGIYVRTWESRLDLIRVLFIGPVGTPYEYAPFIVDLFLQPNFPTEPPQAYFHSWTSSGTGMQGRVNPNLYEDGKICLSLLGTWQGDDTKGEGWAAGKSTVLQLLVSILGLVLVKEPYYSKTRT